MHRSTIHTTESMYRGWRVHKPGDNLIARVGSRIFFLIFLFGILSEVCFYNEVRKYYLNLLRFLNNLDYKYIRQFNFNIGNFRVVSFDIIKKFKKKNHEFFPFFFLLLIYSYTLKTNIYIFKKFKSRKKQRST